MMGRNRNRARRRLMGSCWIRPGWLLPIVAIAAIPASAQEAQPSRQLMPDFDATRTERLAYDGDRFRVPEGFRVEQVASNELVGSVVNFTFDPAGRPLLARDGKGLVILEDRDQDGLLEHLIELGSEIETAHGLYYLGPGDLLVQADGPAEGAGLYRLRDDDGDDRIDRVELIMGSTGKIQEHGPHTIARGPEGKLYTLYGNHAGPDIEPDPGSPLRVLREDSLLPILLDPRGHANTIRAPGGTVWRFDLQGNWERMVGGLRNPFDMAFNLEGELFVYEADMEWDRGLPWFRPTRVLHAIPGGDYGWRTGSAKIAFDSIDTLPSVVDIGRGSPVGVAFYEHSVYPEIYRGALFLGDWSRGRIRVLFPQRHGASWTGDAVDFVLGEPLNVTDLDVGPDGYLYFVTGGRKTSGGLYRVVFDGPSAPHAEAETLMAIDPSIASWIEQPMPRSAWGRQALAREPNDAQRARLLGLLARDRGNPATARASSRQRQTAFELLNRDSGNDGALSIESDLFKSLLADPDPWIRGAAVRKLGGQSLERSEAILRRALNDSDALVARRACEALTRSRAESGPDRALDPETVAALWDVLDATDRFVRYAAREALVQVPSTQWIGLLVADSVRVRPRGAIEGLLALTYADKSRVESELLMNRLLALAGQDLDDETLLDYLRLLELALIRDLDQEEHRGTEREVEGRILATQLLRRYPHGDPRIDRQLERLLGFFGPDGAIEAMLAQLDQRPGREAEIHLVYALRAISRPDAGWTSSQRRRLVEWFDRGRTLRGAASMEGYVEMLFEDVLEILTQDERLAATKARDRVYRERADRMADLLATERGRKQRRKSQDQAEADLPDLAQMSFEEVADYLEYDIMTYERTQPQAGEAVFLSAGCADCHVFGSLGRGGGPDLSTVAKRFRRREILESIVYPSKVISDQYTSVEVTLDDGQVHSGMVVGESDRRLILISANGQRLRLRKSKIQSQQAASTSIMPDGLVDSLDLEDLVNLIHFLERGEEDESGQ